MKMHVKCCLQHGIHFVVASVLYMRMTVSALVSVIHAEYMAVCGWWLMSVDQNNRIKLEIILLILL